MPYIFLKVWHPIFKCPIPCLLTGLSKAFDTPGNFLQLILIQTFCKTINNPLEFIEGFGLVVPEFGHGHTPAVKIQWRQVCRLCWPRMVHVVADYSVPKLLFQVGSDWHSCVRGGTILLKPVTPSSGSILDSWPNHFLEHIKVYLPCHSCTNIKPV